LPHAEFRNGSYHSITFYHEMSPATVAEDVRRGHDTLVRVLGVRPAGFRAPHFGYVQAPAQLAALYAVLGSLGYRFSSSTLPFSAWVRGPLFPAAPGLTEIPVSGSFMKPLHILDSWNHRMGPENAGVAPTYGAALRDTFDRLHARQLSALLNYYADPAQVVGSNPFRDALRHAADLGVETLAFDTLLERLGTTCFGETTA
jgi:peptidoglycan/xylan/chitin deacetylase (PgdA/CDA1 family)